MYGDGVALASAQKQAKKKLTADVCNLEGTLKHPLRCAYYPRYCQVLGHITVGCKKCGMNSNSKAGRKALPDKIKEQAITEELVQV